MAQEQRLPGAAYQDRPFLSLAINATVLFFRKLKDLAFGMNYLFVSLFAGKDRALEVMRNDYKKKEMPTSVAYADDQRAVDDGRLSQSRERLNSIDAKTPEEFARKVGDFLTSPQNKFIQSGIFYRSGSDARYAIAPPDSQGKRALYDIDKQIPVAKLSWRNNAMQVEEVNPRAFSDIRVMPQAFEKEDIPVAKEFAFNQQEPVVITTDGNHSVEIPPSGDVNVDEVIVADGQALVPPLSLPDNDALNLSTLNDKNEEKMIFGTPEARLKSADGIFTFKVDPLINGAMLTHADSKRAGENLVIPSEIKVTDGKTYPVVAVADYAFRHSEFKTVDARQADHLLVLGSQWHAIKNPPEVRLPEHAVLEKSQVADLGLFTAHTPQGEYLINTPNKDGPTPTAYIAPSGQAYMLIDSTHGEPVSKEAVLSDWSRIERYGAIEREAWRAFSDQQKQHEACQKISELLFNGDGKPVTVDSLRRLGLSAEEAKSFAMHFATAGLIAPLETAPENKTQLIPVKEYAEQPEAAAKIAQKALFASSKDIFKSAVDKYKETAQQNLPEGIRFLDAGNDANREYATKVRYAFLDACKDIDIKSPLVAQNLAKIAPVAAMWPSSKQDAFFNHIESAGFSDAVVYADTLQRLSGESLTYYGKAYDPAAWQKAANDREYALFHNEDLRAIADVFVNNVAPEMRPQEEHKQALLVELITGEPHSQFIARCAEQLYAEGTVPDPVKELTVESSAENIQTELCALGLASIDSSSPRPALSIPEDQLEDLGRRITDIYEAGGPAFAGAMAKGQVGEALAAAPQAREAWIEFGEFKKAHEDNHDAVFKDDIGL